MMWERHREESMTMSQLGPNWQRYNVPPNASNAVPRRAVRWHFRWGWLGALLGLIVAILFLRSIAAPRFTWGDVMGALGVHDTARYTLLAVLGMTIIGVVLVLRICKAR
jgi:hypothetical protein